MTDELGRGADPIPASWKLADPERARRARELEGTVNGAVHFKFDADLDPEDFNDEQRVHYILGDDETTHGFIYWRAGCWWWQPRARDIEVSWETDQAPSVELTVESEADAILYARRRAAWDLA